MAHIGKSACDQCSYCTEFCPRYLLGYEVQPHKVMRSLGFTVTGGDETAMVVTDAHGRFAFDVAPGTYRILITGHSVRP